MLAQLIGQSNHARPRLTSRQSSSRRNSSCPKASRFALISAANGARRFAFGRWFKVSDGKLVRIPGDGKREALKLYHDQVADLTAGREIRDEASNEACTIGDLRNRFLSNKQDKLESGELSPSTFTDYRMACDRLRDRFGERRLVHDITPDDFAALRRELADGRSLTSWKNNVNLIRLASKLSASSLGAFFL